MRRWRTASRPRRSRAPWRARRRHLHHRDGQCARAGQARRSPGFFGEGRWNYGARLFVAAGIRVDRITREPLDGDADAFSPRPTFPSDTVVSANPKVSAAWFLGATDGNYTKVRGSAGTGIRPPDAFEIAYTDNPSLEPERSKSFDAGVEQALFGGRGLAEATVFFNNYDDLIVATGSFSGSSQVPHRQHLERARPRVRARRHGTRPAERARRRQPPDPRRVHAPRDRNSRRR